MCRISVFSGHRWPQWHAAVPIQTLGNMSRYVVLSSTQTDRKQHRSAAVVCPFARGRVQAMVRGERSCASLVFLKRSPGQHTCTALGGGLPPVHHKI